MADKKPSEMKNIVKGPIFGVRHSQYILLFWLRAINYSTRFNMSIAIVAMTQRTSSNPDIPYYNWTNKNVVLASFFLGYIFTQIPADYLAKKFGTRKLMSITSLISSLMAVLVPTVAKYCGSEGVMVCRIVQGLAQGFFYPLMSDLLGKWTPVEERSRTGALLSSGTILGLVATYSLTGFLCNSSLGWPMSFYIFGSLGLIISVFYTFIGSDSPAVHKAITSEERFFIEKSLGTTNDSKNMGIPWRHILTSGPLWVITLTALGQGWGTSTVMSEMPTYFDKVLKFDISSNGALLSLPYVVRFVFVFFWGFSADYLTKYNCMSLTNIRKVFNAIGSCGTGILLFIVGFLPETTNRYIVVGFLTASEALHAAVVSGYQINHIDISPNFCGTLMGIINVAEELFSLITPVAVHYIVTDETNRNQWKIVIAIGTIMFVLASVIFGLFATAKRQPWDEATNEKDKSEKENKEKEGA